MSHRFRSFRRAGLIAAAAGLVIAAPTAALASPGPHYSSHHERAGNIGLNQVNLVSDIPGAAEQADNLINPWGLAFGPKSGLWVAAQGSDSARVFALAPGSTAVSDPPVNVAFPDSVLPLGGPTGQVFNPGTRFLLSDGKPAEFIFDTIDGRIEAWNADDGNTGNAEDKATVSGAGYTGLAIATTKPITTTKQSDEQLYAADFSKGTVDVFNSAFQQVTLAPWQFTDPRLPKGYVPFNAQALDGNIFVTYDTLNPNPAPGAGPEGIGPGIGVVDEYSPDGRLIARIATGGPLNAPWGLAIAPGSWGLPTGSLLVGNFGDGHISIFRKEGGRTGYHFTGRVLVASTGKPFAEPGLWALLPGGGTSATAGTGDLWFSAGISTQPGGPLEHGGLLGVLRP